MKDLKLPLLEIYERDLERKWCKEQEQRSFPILVPKALFSSLSRRSLGTRIEGLWRHTIFELIQNFLIGCLKTKKSWAEVKMFALIAGWNSCGTRGVYNAIMEDMEDLGENSHNFSRLNTFNGSTLFAVVTKRLLWLIFSTREAANNLKFWVLNTFFAGIVDRK